MQTEENDFDEGPSYVPFISSTLSLLAVVYYVVRPTSAPDGVWEALMVFLFFIIGSITILVCIGQNVVILGKIKKNGKYRIVFLLNALVFLIYLLLIYLGFENNLI